MSRRARFGWWAAAVLGALAAPVWLIFGGGEKVWLMAATAQSLLSLTGMVWLLRTTPGDAVRLPWWASVVVIVGGGMWTMWSVTREVQSSVWPGALIALYCVVTLRRERIWWSVVPAWHPGWLCLTAMGLDASPFSFVLCFLAFVGAIATTWSGGMGNARQQRATGWIWATSVVLTVACCAWV